MATHNKLEWKGLFDVLDHWIAWKLFCFKMTHIETKIY